MASEHEALVADVALVFCGGDAQRAARILAFIAERTKDATSEMFAEGLAEQDPKFAWRAMHAASALYPHGTDGTEEK